MVETSGLGDLTIPEVRIPKPEVAEHRRQNALAPAVRMHGAKLKWIHRHEPARLLADPTLVDFGSEQFRYKNRQGKQPPRE